MPEQFAGGLFDTAGPQQFKEKVDQIGSSFDAVGQKVDALQKKLGVLDDTLKSVVTRAERLGAAGLSSSTVSSGVGQAPGVVGGGGFLSSVRSTWSNFLGGFGRTDPLFATGGGGGGGAAGGGGGASQGSGLPNGGTSSPTFSARRLALGAGVVGAGALGRATRGLVGEGLTWNQLEFNTQSSMGGSLSGAGRYASNFVGWAMPGMSSQQNVAQLNAAMQSLQGVGGYGMGTQTFDARMNQAGALNIMGQAAGVQGASLSQAAGTIASMGTGAGMQSYMRLGGNQTFGSYRNFNPLTEALAVSQMLARQSAQRGDRAAVGNGGYLSAQALRNNAGPGSPLYSQLQNLGLDPATIPETIAALQRSQTHGAAGVAALKQLALPTTTAAQTRHDLGVLGFSGSELSQQMSYARSKAMATRTLSEGAAGADTALKDAASQLMQAANALLSAAGGLPGHVLGAAGFGLGAAGGLVAGTVGHVAGAAGGALMRAGIRRALGSGIGRAFGRGATAAGERTMATTAAEEGGGIAAGGALALGAAAAGTIGIMAGGRLAAAGRRHRDNLAGGAMNVGGRALEGAGAGAMVGALGGPVGSLIGAGVGAGIGALWGVGSEMGRHHLFPWQSGGSTVGNSGGGPASGARRPVSTPGGGGARIVSDAEKYLGVPYRWGGTNPKTGLDCSGFVQLVFHDMGVNLPRTSEEQVNVGQRVSGIQSAQPGDLLFFGGNGYDGTPSSPGHVGIYVGGGRMIDAPYTGTVVRFDNVYDPVAIRRVGGGNGTAMASNTNAGTTAAGTTSSLIPSVNAGGGGLGEGTTMSETDYLTTALAATFGGSSAVSNGGAANTGATSAAGGGTTGSSPVGPLPAGGHLGLIDQSLKLAGLAVNKANESAVNLIVSHESAWNPSAVNNWDSNAAAGHPSSGLMQVIQPTFQTYAVPGHNTNILDPLSNLIAGERYAVARYGSLLNVPGVVSVEKGGGYVGYALGSRYIEKDEVTTVHKGEAIIPAAQVGVMNMMQLNSLPQGGGQGGGWNVTFAKGSVVIQGGGSGVPAERDLDSLASALADKLEAEMNRRRLVET